MARWLLVASPVLALAINCAFYLLLRRAFAWRIGMSILGGLGFGLAAIVGFVLDSLDYAKRVDNMSVRNLSDSIVLLLDISEPKHHVAAHSRDTPTAAGWWRYRCGGAVGILFGCRTLAKTPGALDERSANRAGRWELATSLFTHSNHCAVHRLNRTIMGLGEG